jgi:hypothetical protein
MYLLLDKNDVTRHAMYLLRIFVTRSRNIYTSWALLTVLYNFSRRKFFYSGSNDAGNNRTYLGNNVRNPIICLILTKYGIFRHFHKVPHYKTTLN